MGNDDVCVATSSTTRIPTSQCPICRDPIRARPLHPPSGVTLQVGQFVASSPTLFPADYVKEFQKCLDKTDAVPWSELLAEDSTQPPE